MVYILMVCIVMADLVMAYIVIVCILQTMHVAGAYKSMVYMYKSMVNMDMVCIVGKQTARVDL